MYTVIPIVYWMRQKAAEFRGKESFQYEEITFHTTDGEPYLEGGFVFLEGKGIQLHQESERCDMHY